MVGPGRLELPTPRLSSVCSNQLSYGPIRVEQHCSINPVKATKPGQDQHVKAWSLSFERKRNVDGGIRLTAVNPKAHLNGVLCLRWSPDWCHLCSKKHGKVHTASIRRSRRSSYQFHSFLRKEVIQPQVPLRLPCYDFTPVADPTVVSCLLAVSALPSGKTNSHGVTGGVYKARERIHRGMLIRDY